MYDERKTGCKEVPNILLKCGYGISNAEIRLLNCSANKVLITTNRILQSTLSTNKSLHVSINNSDGKQQQITGSKTTRYTNGVALHLQAISSPKTMSSQNNEKTEGEPF